MRISLSAYLERADETGKFDPGFALELYIEQVDASDDGANDPFEILAALEEERGESIYETAQRERAEELIEELEGVTNTLKRLVVKRR